MLPRPAILRLGRKHLNTAPMDIDEYKETPLEATYGKAIVYETLMLVCILYLGMKTFWL